MEEMTCSLYHDLANPCYSKKFLPINEIDEGSFLLFGHKVWRILVLAKQAILPDEGANTFLLVDICESHGCDVPARLEDVYLCGVDTHVKSAQGKVFCIPFLQVGQGILLSEKILDGDSQISGLYYEINDMFLLNAARLC